MRKTGAKRSWQRQQEYPFERSGDGKRKVDTRGNRKLSEVLDCDPSYLMSDGAEFISTAAEQYGSRGEKQARLILDQAAAMFAGGDLTDADKSAFMEEIQMLYLDSKERAKKFTPKKYRNTDEGDNA